MVDYIESTKQIDPRSAAISETFFSYPFLDPATGWLHIVGGIQPGYEADCFMGGQILLKLFVPSHPTSLLLPVGFAWHKCSFFIKIAALKTVVHIVL